jgi:hypothetical protein
MALANQCFDFRVFLAVTLSAFEVKFIFAFVFEAFQIIKDLSPFFIRNFA